MLSLSFAAGITHGIIYILLGFETFRLDGFVMWFVASNAVSLISTIFILKYYHFNGYTFPFVSGIISAVLTLAGGITFVLALSNRQLQPLYTIFIFLVMASGAVYGISLLSPAASKKIWLKRTGILTLVLLASLLVLFFLPSLNPNIKPTLLSKTEQWLSLFGNVTILFLILNFLQEKKLSTADDDSISMPKSLSELFPFVGMALTVFLILCGAMFGTDAGSSLMWKTRNEWLAQELEEKSEARYFAANNGDTLHYLLTRPLNFDPTKQYPLVVCLTYGGYQAPAAQFLTEEGNRNQYPAFLLTPYCEEGFGWGGVPGYTHRDQILCDALNNLKEPIDRKRQYVAGISLGGYGSWHLITEHPDMFAAALPVCGGGNTALAGRVKNIPVWAFHGAKDNNVPVSESRNMIAAIQSAGGAPRYTEFPNKAHHIWYDVTITPGVLDWLFAQHK